jgi:hypothetical protein
MAEKEVVSRKRAYICEEHQIDRKLKVQNRSVVEFTPSKIKLTYINDIREGAYHCISVISNFCVKTFLKAFLTSAETGGSDTASGGGSCEVNEVAEVESMDHS